MGYFFPPRLITRARARTSIRDFFIPDGQVRIKIAGTGRLKKYRAHERATGKTPFD